MLLCGRHLRKSGRRSARHLYLVPLLRLIARINHAYYLAVASVLLAGFADFHVYLRARCALHHVSSVERERERRFCTTIMVSVVAFNVCADVCIRGIVCRHYYHIAVFFVVVTLLLYVVLNRWMLVVI